MRRIAFIPLLCVTVAVGCGKDTPTPPPNPNSYQLIMPEGVTLGQDSTAYLSDFGLRVVKNGTDTVPGPNTTSQPIPRLSYFIENTDIVILDPSNGQFGNIRALQGGTTTIRAVGYDQEITFPVTVVPRPATSVILRVLSGPAGGLIPVANRTDTGTFYALPTDRLSSRLEGLVLVGTDTVFCSYCGVKNPARIQREVSFRSLNPALATVSNAANPFIQRTSQTGTNVNTDTTGYVTVFDTSSTPVGIVMEVPGDDLADTVWLTFKLRPLDTLRVRPDSNNFPPNGIDQIGTQRRIYPNSDTLQANVVASSSVNFIAGVDYLFRVNRLNTAPSATSAAATTLPVRSSGAVTVRREVLPIVQWESALEAYLKISPIGTWLGAVVAPCAFIGGSCPAPSRNNATNTQRARDSLVITCSDLDGNKLPGRTTAGALVAPPIQFSGDGLYTVPSCNPVHQIPMPGAFCTTASSTDLSSTCTIWIQATTTDQASGKILRDKYRINVRR